QVELHGQRIDDIDAVDRVHLAAAHAALGGEVAVQLVLDRLGVELLAVLELHAVAEVDDEVGGVLPRVAGRQHRHDVQLHVDVEQLVADAGEHDAADIGGAEGGIEQIRVLAQADMQDAILRQRRRGKRYGAKQTECEPTHGGVLPGKAADYASGVRPRAIRETRYDTCRYRVGFRCSRNTVVPPCPSVDCRCIQSSCAGR